MKWIMGVCGFVGVMAGMLAAGGATSLALAHVATPFKGQILGSFFFYPCPPGAPEGALCLHDEVVGRLTHLGRTTGSFEVVFDLAEFGEDSCGPIRKQGSFTAANGDQLEVEAEGRFCFDTVVAEYQFRITGGTGRFVGASGGGSWVVPAPATFDGTSGTGGEFLTGTLQR